MTLESMLCPLTLDYTSWKVVPDSEGKPRETSFLHMTHLVLWTWGQGFSTSLNQDKLMLPRIVHLNT